MEKTIIEKFATGAVRDRMLKTGCIDPVISEGDKELSWDGTLCVYKQGCTFSKANLEARVFLQVKGHVCDNLTNDKIRFDADVDDLKNYSINGGALYFVVYVTQSGDTQVYYAELTPFRLAELIDQCTPSQKTKRIELKALPEDKDEVAKIVREFPQRCIHNEGKRAKIELPLVSAMTAGSFVGRERELAQMEAELANGTNPIFLSGFGGMGKTELAVKFGKNYRDSGRGNVYMVTFQESFYKTLMQSIAPQIPGLLQNTKDEKLIYDTVIHHLKQWSKDDILIIDNADEDSGNFTKLQDDTYRQLVKLPFHMIITTRCNVNLAVKAEPLEREQLRSLFDLYNVDISLEERDALIDSVNSHTMTVDMIAQTMADSFLTVEQVLQAMRTGMMDEDFIEIGVYHNQDQEQRRIDGHLLALFRAAKLGQEAKKVLSCAILLPQGGMDVDTFRNALPEDSRKALTILTNRQWMKFDHGTRLLTIHPVIRLVCRLDIEGWKDYCPEFLTRLHENQDKKKFKLDIYSQMADMYKNAVTEGIPTDRAMWHYLTAWYLWRQGQYQEALEFELECFHRREEVLDENDPDMAHVCNDLGVLYDHLSNHKNALKFKEQALMIRLSIPDIDEKDLAQSYNNVGMTYGDMGDHLKALEYVKKGLDVRKQSTPDNDPDLAMFYNNIGLVYGDLGEPQKALPFLQQAMNLQKALPEDHPYLAIVYDNVGKTYDALGDYDQAIEYERRALEISQKSLSENHPDIAGSLSNMGSTYGKMGELDKSLEYALRALEIRKQVLPALHSDMAISLNNVGGAYGALGEKQKELYFYKEALKIFISSLPENHPHIATSYSNISVAYFESKDYRNALNYAEEAVRIAKKCPYGEHSGLEEFKKFVKMLKRIVR